MIPKLTKSDLECRRTVCELYAWVRQIHRKFGETDEGKSAMRLRNKRYLKEFADEIWPLANYARLFFWGRSDVYFKPVIGNQSYDALLVDKSGSTLCRFEITRALYGEEGYQDRLRREHLDQHGYAFQFGPPPERDPNSGGVIKSRFELSDERKDVRSTLRQIRTAIEAKASKPHSADTVLIVVFEGVHLQEAEYQEALDAEAKSVFCGLASGFSELALIDETARFGFRYPIPGKPDASQRAVARS